ncbi:hypothetical protein AAZX31_05G206900 [Glycine max]
MSNPKSHFIHPFINPLPSIKIIKITIHQDKQTKTRERYSNIVIIKKTDYLLPRLSKLSKHTDKLIDFEHTMPHEMCK